MSRTLESRKEEFREHIQKYREAVEERVESGVVRPFKGDIVAQLMPRADFSGGLFIKRELFPKDGTIPQRYGTVLEVGRDIEQIDPGDTIIFSRMLGKKFSGLYHPFDKGRFQWDDEIRIFSIKPEPIEIIGVVEYNLAGSDIRYKVPGREEVTEATVTDETPLFGGAIQVEGKDGWIPMRWMEEVVEE